MLKLIAAIVELVAHGRIAEVASTINKRFLLKKMRDGAEGASALSGAVAVMPGNQVCLVVKSNIPAAAPYSALDNITVTATFTPLRA